MVMGREMGEIKNEERECAIYSDSPPKNNHMMYYSSRIEGQIISHNI
jgi:hypothetical protein